MKGMGELHLDIKVDQSETMNSRVEANIGALKLLIEKHYNEVEVDYTHKSNQVVLVSC